MRIGIAGPIDPRRVAAALGVDDAGLPAGLGGSAATSIVVALLRAGHEVCVYSLSPDVDEDVHYEVGPVRMHFGTYRAQHRARDFFKVERAAIERFVRLDPADVVHAHWTYEFALGALAARPGTIVSVHDWAPTILRLNKNPYRLVRLLMNRRVLRAAKRVVCNSPYTFEKVKRVATGKVCMIPNMLQAEQYACGPRTSRAGYRMLAAASWGRLKNGKTLLRAFRTARQELPRAELLLCGDGFGPGQDAETWARAHGCHEGVSFIGHTSHSDLSRLMFRSDVFIHPSLEESFGMVLAEAMAQGTPVIAGASSGAVPWLLADGAAGVLTDIRDPAAIARAAVGLLSDAEAWRRYSEAGFARARDTFHEGVVVPELERVYREMLDR